MVIFASYPFPAEKAANAHDLDVMMLNFRCFNLLAAMYYIYTS